MRNANSKLRNPLLHCLDWIQESSAESSPTSTPPEQRLAKMLQAITVPSCMHVVLGQSDCLTCLS